MRSVVKIPLLIRLFKQVLSWVALRSEKASLEWEEGGKQEPAISAAMWCMRVSHRKSGSGIAPMKGAASITSETRTRPEPA